MKRKIIATILSVMTLVTIGTFTAIPTQAGSYEKTVSVGGGIKAFTTDYYFDSHDGICRAKYNTVAFKELGVQAQHKKYTHYGTVDCGTKNNITNVKAAGEWTNRADVRIYSNTSGTVRVHY